MDRQQREYKAILEQVTREASLQAELDLRVGRNFPGNILNRLDIQARLGSRVAPIEEPTSRLGHGSSVLRQQLSGRTRPLLQPYSHLNQPEHSLSGFSSQLLTRLDTPLPLMSDDARIRNIRSSLRNHSPVQHGSFADDLYPQENFQSQVDHPVRPLMSIPTETQQRVVPETQEERRMLSQGGSLSKKSNRPLVRPPVSQKSQASPPSSRFISNLRGSASSRSPSNSPVPSANKKSNITGGSDHNWKKLPLTRDKLVRSSKTPVKVDSKSGVASAKTSPVAVVTAKNPAAVPPKTPAAVPPKTPVIAGKTPVAVAKTSAAVPPKIPVAVTKTSAAVPPKAPVVAGKAPVALAKPSAAPVKTPVTHARSPIITAKTSLGSKVEKEGNNELKQKAQAPLPSEKKMPSLFGPPPSAPVYKSTNETSNTHKSTGMTSNKDNAVEIVESLPPRPLMDLTPSLAALPFSNTVFSQSNLQSESSASTVKTMQENSGSLQLQPKTSTESIPNTGKPVPLLDVKPVPLFNIPLVDVKNTPKPLNTKKKNLASLEPPMIDKPILLEQYTTREKETKDGSSKEAAREKSTEQKKDKTPPLPSPTEEVIEIVEESHDVARPLWYTNPDSLSVGTSSVLTGDIEENCNYNEVEEGEITGESQSDEMELEIVESNEPNYHKIGNSVLVTPEITSTEESSSSVLRKFYATPEEFKYFLPFPAEASEENVKSIEKCWQQLLVLHSFTMKQKRVCAQKTLSRIKSHFAQNKTKPSNGVVQFCFKLWSQIATYLGAYLQQRIETFVRGLVHRSMIDFVLIHMHKKKMPRSLKNVSIKGQINLLYIFNMQGFTNATNNYMVKWLQDELEKVSTKLNSNSLASGAIRLDVHASIASARLNSLVLDDQLLEKKFCLVEYLKVKSFSDPKEVEHCIRMCTLLKCQDYMPNAEWKYEKSKPNQASRSPDTLKTDVTSNKDDKVTLEPGKPTKSVAPKLHEVHLESSKSGGSQKVASQPGGDESDDSKTELKIDVPSTPSGSEKDDLRQSDVMNVENKGVSTQKTVKTILPTDETEKDADNKNVQTVDNGHENVSIAIPEIEVTPAEKTAKMSGKISMEKHHHSLNVEPHSKKKGGHSRKLHSNVDTAGKWRSYTVDGSNSSRIVSRKRKQDITHRARRHLDRYRARSSSLDRNQLLSNRSSSGERSQRSDGNRAVDSDSDSEDLEMMMLRRNALQSMLKSCMAKNSGSNSNSQETQADGKDKMQSIQKDLKPSNDRLAVEQISDTEGTTSPVAYSIGESGVVLVSLGTDNVVSFPSQYSSTLDTTTELDKPVHNKEAKGNSQMPLEKQKDIVDEKTESATVTFAASGLKQNEESSKPSNESTPAYYKVSTGSNEQKQAEKGKQSFVICVTSEESDSDATNAEVTGPPSAVTSGTSSPMPNQQDNSSLSTRKDLEELIQLYKRRAKEKEANDQGSLKSPDAIKIMPQPKQAEYRILKEQLAQLEKKKNERKKANKRKATIPPESRPKKLKANSANKDETDNQQQQNETFREESSKKEIEYQTNIAVCEVQLEELKVTIDRGYSDVMRLNKQLSDCVLEIEEHTMKLQLLNKQLKIAKESLEVAQAKQQEIKNKVKLAQNNLLKDKNAVTVVEGELAHFRSLLIQVQQQPRQSPTQQNNNQMLSNTVESPVKEEKSSVMDVTIPMDDSEQGSTADQQTPATSDDIKDTTSDVINSPNIDSATTTTGTASETNSPLSLRKKLGTKEKKTIPGQKIANVVKKLSQERTTPAPAVAAAASSIEEATVHNEDRSTCKSLDAVVAKLHIVKQQELEKQFHVDLGPAKQVRESTKLDSVVEMLVAKQSQAQPSISYPVSFETPAKPTTKVNTAVASSKCMEADVSSTVPDNLEDNKMDVETKSVIAEASKAKSTKIPDKPVVVAGIANKQEKRQENVNDSVINTALNKQAVQMKLTTGAKSSKVETAHSATDSEIARSTEQVDTKDRVVVSSLPSLSTKLPTLGTSIMLTSRMQCTLAKVTKVLIEKFAITPKDLEDFLGQASLKEISNDSISGNLTEYYFNNSQIDVHQQSPVPDAVFVKLLQPVQFQDPSTGSSSPVSSYYNYKSPLSCFKSYRLHPYYRTRAKLAISSSTYSNKISPNKIMCKFNMTGKCSDKNCEWQHWNETQMNSNELFSDIVSYAPDLAMITNDDDTTVSQNKISAHTANMVSSLGGKMTTDEIGVYLVDQVVNNSDNRTFNARIEGKVPVKSLPETKSSSSIQRPKSFTSDFKAVFDSTYIKLGTLGQLPAKSSTQQPDRYFCLCEQSSHEVDSSCDPKAVVASVRENVLQNHSGNIEKVHKSATALLEAALRTNPQEEVLWIELMKIHASSFVKLPVDPVDLNLFQSVCKRAIKATDSYNVFQKCISLLPTYNTKRVWYIKGYEMVKLKVNEEEKSIQCLELFLGLVVLDYMTGYTVEAIEKMKYSLRLKEYQANYPFKDLLNHLTCDDLLLFWMVYIYYCHSHAFPDCVIKTTTSGCRILQKKTFIIQWKEGERLSALYNNFIQLFKMALKHCKSVYSEKYPHHTSAVYALQFQNMFENLILLEYKCGDLEAAKISIRKVLSVHPSYLGMWLLLADVVVKCGYKEGYKEVYVEAENILRGNVEFYHIVSKKLHQQGDRNEAIRWLTSCVHSKYTGKCLNATEYDVVLHYRKLLKQPVPYDYQTSTLVSECSMDDVPHLWLCYCLYLELAGAPQVASEYWPTAEDAYEAAVHSVHSPTGIRLAWKEYLAYLRSSATSKDAGITSWKQFLDCINRAFQVVDPEDHKFQIEVVDMCIAALPADHADKALGLYNQWIKMFPYNAALVCRCSDAAIKLDHTEMAQNVLATYLISYPEDWDVWKKAIEIEINHKNIEEVRWMYWEASKSSLFNIFFWKEFLKFELQQCIVTEDVHQVTTVLQHCHHLGINLTKLVS